MDASAESFVSYRWARPEDYETLGQIMYDAIHALPSAYSSAQRQAWCPKPPSGPDWNAKLTAQHVAVAAQGQHLLGMVTLGSDGYLDLAFLLPEARGNGHLRQMVSMIQTRALSLELVAITTHASLTAQAPFAALGFDLLRHETVERLGQQLPRALMRLSLETAGPDGAIR